MRAQLGRLVEASKQPNVTLQVLPFSVGAHAGMDGAFMILVTADSADGAASMTADNLAAVGLN